MESSVKTFMEVIQFGTIDELKQLLDTCKAKLASARPAFKETLKFQIRTLEVNLARA